MYAITFDLDARALKASCSNRSWHDACADIHDALRTHGFNRQQGSIHFGDRSVNAVTCVLAAQDLACRFPWFAPAVRDMRMFRVEENNGLMPAIELALMARNTARRNGRTCLPQELANLP